RQDEARRGAALPYRESCPRGGGSMPLLRRGNPVLAALADGGATCWDWGIRSAGPRAREGRSAVRRGGGCERYRRPCGDGDGAHDQSVPEGGARMGVPQAARARRPRTPDRDRARRHPVGPTVLARRDRPRGQARHGHITLDRLHGATTAWGGRNRW